MSVQAVSLSGIRSGSTSATQDVLQISYLLEVEWVTAGPIVTEVTNRHVLDQGTNELAIRNAMNVLSYTFVPNHTIASRVFRF
jgi:hypothetical protein